MVPPPAATLPEEITSEQARSVVESDAALSIDRMLRRMDEQDKAAFNFCIRQAARPVPAATGAEWIPATRTEFLDLIRADVQAAPRVTPTGGGDGAPPVASPGRAGEERVDPLRTRPDYDFRCDRCGAPHNLDTSIPSEAWNAIMLAGGALCTLCIDDLLTEKGLTATAEFYFVGRALTSRLYGSAAPGAPERREGCDG